MHFGPFGEEEKKKSSSTIASPILLLAVILVSFSVGFVSREGTKSLTQLAKPPAAPIIFVYSPNGGETFVASSSPVSIQWYYTRHIASSLYTLKLMNGGLLVQTIATNIAGVDQPGADPMVRNYTWTIPGNVSPEQYKIRVEVFGSAIFDESDAPFQINNPFPFIQAIAPNPAVAGQPVTLTGWGFHDSTGGATSTINWVYVYDFASASCVQGPQGVFNSNSSSLTFTLPSAYQKASSTNPSLCSSAPFINGGNYLVRVVNPAGGSNSSPFTVTAANPPSIVSLQGNCGNLSWSSASGNPTEYHVERCTGVACTSFAERVLTTNTSYTDSSRTPGTTYRYRVKAHRHTDNVYGAYSNILTDTCATVSLTRVGFDNSTITAPPGTVGRIDSLVGQSANPAVYNELSLGTHIAYATDVTGFIKSVGFCVGTTCVPSTFTPVSCSAGECSFSFNVSTSSSASFNKVYFKYTTQ